MIEREPMSSKYCTSRGFGALGSSNVPRKSAPSTGSWVTPSTVAGTSIPHAPNRVGSTSIAWTIWSRTSPRARMPFGQCTINGVRVPPNQVKRFQSWSGVFPAHAQPHA